MAKATIKPSINLDQWADGAAPDIMVSSGSQADQWQNGNLGSSQAHYSEGDWVPYRAVLSNLKEGQTYWVTIQWDTTKSGKHALDYIGTWNQSFPAGRNETQPNPIQGISGLLTNNSTTSAIPIDPNAPPSQQAGAFTLFGGASNISYVLAGPDGKIGTSDDTTSANPYTVTGSYAGDSSTYITVKFTYTGDGDGTLGEIGSAVLAWGGHIATRADWGSGNSAAAISGSPYHTSLTSFVDDDPNTSESVGSQDRSLSSAAVTFPGSIVVVKQTDPDGNTSESFDFELTRPMNSVDVIGGKLDISGDGVIDGNDDGRFTDAGGEVFSVADGNVSGQAGGDGKVGTYSIVNGGLDINASGGLTVDDRFTNLAGLGIATFSLKDGESRTFNNLLEFGSYTLKEVNIPTDWDLTSINTSRTDINNSTTNATLNDPSGNQAVINLAEADQWVLTFNDAFIAAPSVSILKTVTDVDGRGASAKVDAAGNVILYSIVIANTGNVALSSINVTDKVEALGATAATYVSGDGNGNNALDIDESWTYSASYLVSQDDLDSNGGGDGDVDNTATVTTAQTDPQDSSAAVELDLNRALEIDKEFVEVNEGETEADSVGDIIHYEMLVTNKGNVALTGVDVDDPLLSNTAFAGGDTDGDGKLDVSETWKFTGSYTVTQADLDGEGNALGDYDIDNTATASADDTPPDDDTEEVPLDLNRAIAIDKQFVKVNESESEANSVGDVIHYRMLVTNPGNTALDNVNVTDPLLTNTVYASGDTDLDTRLDVGETWIYTGSYAITQADLDGEGNALSDYDIDNTATATADPDLSDEDSLQVPLAITRGLAIDKMADGVTGGNGDAIANAAGDIIHYKMVVTNTGNTALDNVLVSDPLLADTAYDSGDTDADGRLDVDETWTYKGSYTVTQADLDGAGNAGSDHDIDNTATASADETPSDDDTEVVPLTYSPSMAITKTPDVPAAGLNDVITYTITLDNNGNVTLTNVTLTDPLLSGEAYASGDLDGDQKLDVDETWTYTGSYTVTQAVIDNNGVDYLGVGDNDGDIDNTATGDSAETSPVSASADVDLFGLLPPDIDVEKYVSVDGGSTWLDADLPTGPVVLPGTIPQFKFVVTGDAGFTLNNVVLSDSDFDLNGSDSGTSINVGTLAPGQVYELILTNAPVASGQHTNTASVVGQTVLGVQVDDADDANYFAFTPITVTGSPQFNFPNDLEKIQPKLQGSDAFILNPMGYISWDLFTSDNKLANIDTAANFLSEYAGLTVSIQEIWNSVSIGDKTTSGADAIYRIYVANESNTSVALDNSHNIVVYDIVALSTNKGLIDLINSDPLIGNFNSFSNIENAIDKAGNGFTTGNTPTLTAGADRVWSSTNVTGTGTNETPAPVAGIDGGTGNDAIYGRNNGTATTETLIGGIGNDMLEARDGGDIVNGGLGNDYLFGSLSGDVLIGGDGNDILFGGYGSDQLTGGDGNDTFILRKGDFDTIMDLDVTAGGGDLIKVWLQSLDNVAATGTHNAAYDESNGILSVDGMVVAQIVGSYTEAQVLAHLVYT